MKMGTMGWLTFVLVIVGGLNWGLVGVADFNLVNTIFGGVPALERIIYILVGLSALYMLLMGSKMGKSSGGQAL